MSRTAAVVAIGAALLGGLAACSSTGSPGVHQLPTGTTFDYQLGSSYSPPKGVTIVARDSTAKPVPGLYNICYVNAFQTQNDQKNLWLSKYPFLVLRTDGGAPVFDPGWPGEMILDVSTASKRAAIAAVQDKTIDLCKKKGFQAVEFDNLDSYTRSQHAFTLSADAAEAKLLVARAHADGLAAGQKNTSQLGSRGKTQLGYDFAIAEECYRYKECASYTKVYGAAVLDIEYAGELRGTFASACASTTIPPMTILRDRELLSPTSKAYVYKTC
jgi:hypothetical protein